MLRFASISMLILSSLLTSSGLGRPAADSVVELKLICDKSTYLIGEPIVIDILAINHGPDSASVPYLQPMIGSIRLLVVNNGCDTLPYKGLVLDLLGPTSYRLAPGDTLYAVINLLNGFCCSKSASPFYKRPLQGPVSVTASYSSSVISNTLSIDIVEPTGDEKTSYDLLYGPGGSTSFPPLNFDNFSELITRFPNSVYAPCACQGLELRDSETRREMELLLLERYPNSGIVEAAIGIILDGTKGAERDAKLDSLMTADKPFRLRMIARSVKRGIQFF